MANNIHNLGLELPIYGPETEIITKEDLRVGKPLPRDGFVREVGVWAVGFCSLKDVLEATDSELEVVAELTGSTVIDYQWGLYRVEQDALLARLQARWQKQNNQSITSGSIGALHEFMLVAKVPTIQHARKLWRFSPRYKALQTAASRYHCDRREGNEPHLTDMGAYQFIKGRHNSSKGVFLVDIEPRIKK